MLISLARHVMLLVFGFVLFAAASPHTHAQTPAQTSEETRRQEARAAYQAAVAAATRGPASVPLLDEANLRLPGNMIFVPPAESVRLLRAWGNKVAKDPIGIVIGTRQDDDWAIIVRFIADGYIKDDDAKDWDADKMLEAIRAHIEDSNNERAQRGFPEMEVIGWVARPQYDAQTHRLASSLAQRVKNAPDNGSRPVNYITYALGRAGYFSLEMLTNQSHVAHDKDAVQAVLAGLEYNRGRRYTEFNASTDHIAEYGLAALVGVVAAKKLGLLALGGLFLAKFAKLGAIIVAGGAALGTKLFKRKRDTA